MVSINILEDPFDGNFVLLSFSKLHFPPGAIENLMHML